MNLLEHLKGKGKVCYVVSQNVDGLHRNSGLRGEDISELHGNSFKSVCWKCDTEILHTRTIASRGRTGHGYTTCPECQPRYFCHCTVMKCEKCGSYMKDSIIHFKENLPQKALELAFKHAGEADLCICLGSSLTVSPACHIPRDVHRAGGKVVIVNLQKTPLDDIAALRLFGKTDAVMEQLARLLGISTDRDGESGGKGDGRGGNSEVEVNELPSTTISSIAAGGQGGAGGGDDDDIGLDLGGYVQPKSDCPHTRLHTAEPTLEMAQRAFKDGCECCGATQEPWFCLDCQKTLCGRYVKGHMKQHTESTSHQVRRFIVII